jgi:hypothetical protein
MATPSAEASAAPRTASCGPDATYAPHAAASRSVTLPAVPTLDLPPRRSGDAFTVWGAGYTLRSAAHRAEVEYQVRVVGYITKTNLADAPRCAVHRDGTADPADCHAPIPTFWLGDTPDAPESECIQVMGWASSYAQIYEAMRQYDADPDANLRLDSIFGLPIPNPLPAKGAKVLVLGDYSEVYTRVSARLRHDPLMGILTVDAIDLLEPAPELATLPGLRRCPGCGVKRQ